MTSRRSLLMGGLGLASAAGLAACTKQSAAPKTTTAPTSQGSGSSAPSGPPVDMPLWYWDGGLSDAVAKASVGTFAASMKISPTKVSGDFKQKLMTSLAAGKGLPGVTGLKGEDVAFFRTVADKFVDLNTVGAAEAKKNYLEWKWAEATTTDGKQLGIPIDIGPTVMYYRHDLFADAGLPSDPAELATKLATWDEFVAMARTMKEKKQAYFISTITDMFPIFMGQGEGTSRFVSPDNTFTGDTGDVLSSWNRCMQLISDGLTAKTGKTYQVALNKGTLAADLGAAWHALDIKQNAPSLKGKWSLTSHPGKPTNFGGSFLGIPKGANNPERSMELILWLLNADNCAKGFADASIFPANPAAYEKPELTAPDPYFNNQKTIDVFSKAASSVLRQFKSPFDDQVAAPYYTELENVEVSGKDPKKAWDDAVKQAKQIAQRAGVK